MLAALLLMAASAATHEVRPGDDPQAVMDRARPGDRLVFREGVHLRKLGKHRSMLYVDKSVDIELEAGAVLRLADGESKLQKDPEITTDHGAPKTIDDFEVGGDYDLGLGAVLYSIRIDGEGTFTWGSGGTFDFQHAKVPITGDWQTLSHGVRVRFPSKTGYSIGSLWFISYDGPEAYGIRIGHGTQPDYIENVRIYGRGTVDLNSGNNAEPSGMVKNINATVLVHGRVRNVSIEGITMRNTMRSVMLYGEHTGKFLQGGAVGPGESFDAENISIFHTRTINPKGSGYLLGHPSHRGWLRKVRCNYNYMETATTSIEPNFQLDQYEVIGNVIKSGGRAIHCWRRSTNGLVANNVRIDDTTGKEVVMVNAPGAWQSPENVVLRDNRNHQSEPLGYWANVSGGQDNRATGAYAAVTGGQGSVAEAQYARAQGHQARARRQGEDVIAAGSFQAPGDAQTSVLVARAETKDDALVELRPGAGFITVPKDAAVSFRVLVVGRAQGGREHAGFEAAGIAYWAAGQVVVKTFRDAGGGLEVSGGERLRLLVRGARGVAMRWVARVELAEVGF